MRLAPITLRDAAEYIGKYHRHTARPKSWKFGISLRGPRGGLLGVVVVARPKARRLDDGITAEITRLCTRGHRNACSKLYAAARRAAFAMGYTRIVTYTLSTERGSSLRASGFEAVAETRAEAWDRPSRPRAAGPIAAKTRWESRAGA
jgi:hypothetical protein